MKTPAEIYVPSAQRWSGTPEQISYPKMSTRKVNTSGYIKYEGEKIFVSTSLSGWDVGTPTAKGRKTQRVISPSCCSAHMEPETRGFHASADLRKPRPGEKAPEMRI